MGAGAAPKEPPALLSLCLFDEGGSLRPFFPVLGDKAVMRSAET